ncbi:MAG: AAA family ATPase [Gammaproteobacteria bacterium]
MAVNPILNEADVAAKVAGLADVREAIGQVIVGQAEVVEHMLIGLLAGGHCLIEGVPGLGKTLLVNSLARAMTLNFRRIQFTPDLMPSDVIGTEILEEDHGTGKRSFKFQPGPVFANILLADEINRTPAKTQAALLEAMQECSVTYAGETHTLNPPFFVLATQNPLEQSGTYALPEAQLDRFLLHIEIDYPTLDEETEVLRRTTGASPAPINKVMSADDVLALQALTRQVSISDGLLHYVTHLIRATRPGKDAVGAISEWVKWGAGPRAGQALILASKGRALLHGRYAVTRDDLHAMVLPVLRHRLILNFHAEAEQKRVADIVDALLTHYPAPDDPIAG